MSPTAQRMFKFGVGISIALAVATVSAGIWALAHSPFVDHGRTRYADMIIYTAPSGALVFATGSMQWCWGLDGYNAPGWHELRTTAVAQQVMRNVLNRMLAGPAAPRVTVTWLPSTIVTLAVIVAAVFVLRAWLSVRMAR